MRGELIEYNGEMLTLNAIAVKENVSRQTLTDWYKRTNNIYEAMNGLRKSLAQRNISYYDEILSLKAISEREKIKFESLKKFYEQCDDIYEAVKLTKSAQAKRNGNILYKGKLMSALSIANMEGIDAKSLRRHFDETNDIELAVQLTIEAKNKQNGTILYNGNLMTITGIANLEGIKRDTLKEFYELYNNIDKAVFLTKESQKRRRQALYKNNPTSIESFSKYYKISVLKLNELIESGLSLDDVEKQIEKNNKPNREIIMYNGQSLYQFCLDHGYNYWVINHIINKYNKTVEEAINEYVLSGQQIPTKWIYEKYNILFKHLMLKFGFDSNRVIKIIKEENCDIEDALIKLIFISDKNLKSVESNWLEELYRFIKSSNSSELDDIYRTFYVDEREKEILKFKDNQVENIKRELLLFEFSEVIDIWNKNELYEMFDLYNISDAEIITIYSELYMPFIDGVINPSNDNIKIGSCIRKAVLSNENEYSFSDLNDNQITYCLNKISLIKSIIDERNAIAKNNSNTNQIQK